MSDSIRSRLLSAVKTPKRTLLLPPPRRWSSILCPTPGDTSRPNLRIIPSTIEPVSGRHSPLGRVEGRSKRLSLASHDTEAGGAEDQFFSSSRTRDVLDTFVSVATPTVLVYHTHVCRACSFFPIQRLSTKVFQ